MEDVIDRSGHIDKLGDVMLDDPEPGVIREMAEVDGSAGHQIVDGQNFPVACEEIIAKVGSEEAGAPRDYRAQEASLSAIMLS